MSSTTKCSACGRTISDAEQAYIRNDDVLCGRCYTKKPGAAAWVITPVIVFGLALAGLVVGTNGFKGHRLSGGSNTVKEFQLNDLVGVECYYTDKYTIDRLGVLGTTQTVAPSYMDKVIVKKILSGREDYEHPYSLGYKIYLSLPGSASTLVLYPKGTRDKDGNVSWYDVPLCPIDKLTKAREAWEGKSFRFDGTKLGDVELEQGTIVKVLRVMPYDFRTFDVTFQLPATTCTTLMSLEYNDLKPL